MYKLQTLCKVYNLAQYISETIDRRLFVARAVIVSWLDEHSSSS